MSFAEWAVSLYIITIALPVVALELGDDDSESNSCLFCFCGETSTRSGSGKLGGGTFIFCSFVVLDEDAEDDTITGMYEMSFSSCRTAK